MTPDFPETLRRLIADKNLTPALFAKRVNLSKAFCSGLLSGKKKPPKGFAELAAQALELGPDATGRLALSARLAASDPGLRDYVRHLEKAVDRFSPEAIPIWGPALSPTPDPVPSARRFAAKKSEAIGLIRAIMDAEWYGGTIYRGTWRYIAAMGRSLAFRDDDEKKDYVIIQVSYVIRHDDSVVVIDRRSAEAPRDPPRTTAGASLLQSFSPDPTKGLREQVDARLRSSVCPEDRKKRTLHWRVSPLGLILNSVNVVGKDPDAGKPPVSRPVYVMIACEVVVDRPVHVFGLGEGRQDDDRQARSRRIQDLRFSDFEGNGDKAVAHRLRHPDSERCCVAVDSAILVRADRMKQLDDPSWEKERISNLRSAEQPPPP